jgi:hypothetical protein
LAERYRWDEGRKNQESDQHSFVRSLEHRIQLRHRFTTF